MANIESIKEALKTGIEPRMICMTCPWDRFCLTPPSMTSKDIERIIDQMKEKSIEQGNDSFMGSLMGAVMFTGKDTQGVLCPILVNRLQTSDGRKIIDNIRTMMQEWED